MPNVNINALLYLKRFETGNYEIRHLYDFDIIEDNEYLLRFYIPLWNSKKFKENFYGNQETIYVADKVIYVSDNTIVSYANSKDMDFAAKYMINDFYTNDDMDVDTFIDAVKSNLRYNFYGDFEVKIPVEHVFLVSTVDTEGTGRDYLLLGLDIDENDILNSPVIVYPYGNIYDTFEVCWGENESNNVKTIADWFSMYHNKDLFFMIRSSVSKIFEHYNKEKDYSLPSWQIAARSISREIERVKERYKNGEDWRKNTFLYTRILDDFIE